MTLRGSYAPVLDRLIQREVTTTVEVPATTAFAYDAQELSGGNRVDDGEWRRDSDTELAIGLNDSNGLSFPDLTLSVSAEVAFDGAAATTLTITDMVLLRNPFGLPLGILLTFGGALPAAGTALTIAIATGGTQTVTQTAMRSVWAARRDFRARDQAELGDGDNFTLEDSRFVVRFEGPSWNQGDTFIDDGGQARTVRGVNEIGRGRWLELLARSIG